MKPCDLLRLLLRALGLALLALMLTSAMAQAKAMYTTETAELYKRNKAGAKVLLTLEAGKKVNVVAVKKPWAKVKAGGKAGFMKVAQLSPKAPAQGENKPEEESGEIRFTNQKTKLYQAMRTSAKALAQIPAGAEVELLSAKGKWGAVRYGKKKGYVPLARLSKGVPPADQPSEPAPTPPSPPGEQEKYPTLKPGDSGEAVKQLQKRLKELEWFYGDIGGNYKTLTTQAVRDFQEAVDLKATGIADSATQGALYASDAPKNVISSNGSPAPGKAVSADWWTSGIQSAFARGMTATVTDVETGLSWKVVRSGGTNHADVQPKTAQDTAIMKKAYGGNWSWNRRAIWVSVGGIKYAASMNGMPHGSGSIKENDFDGHHCIHFTNSRTHGSNLICSLHQAAIRHALAA